MASRSEVQPNSFTPNRTILQLMIQKNNENSHAQDGQARELDDQLLLFISMHLLSYGFLWFKGFLVTIRLLLISLFCCKELDTYHNLLDNGITNAGGVEGLMSGGAVAVDLCAVGEGFILYLAVDEGFIFMYSKFGKLNVRYCLLFHFRDPLYKASTSIMV
ncbi:hypothetical protein ACJX0J_025839, partial [Zea mays]